MNLSLSGVLGDAVAMWRGHRDVLGAITGVFFVVPILGILFLMAQAGLPTDGDPVKLSEAMQKFYGDNLLVFLLASVLIDFGTVAVLMLMLRAGERTLSETLALTLRGLLPFLVIDVTAKILFGLGASLFLLPGLFAFGRTWLAAPALAASPDLGLLGAFRQGWRRSDGLRWLVLIAASVATVMVAVFAILLSSVPLGLIAAATGDNQFLEMAGYLLVAALGGIAWVTLALVRVAAYRRTEPSAGI